jgi:hypothetical protein
MLIKLQRLKQKDSMKNSVSTLTDHSTLDQDFQCKELLNAMVPTTFGSRDGEMVLKPSNGTLMKFQRPSRTTTGNLIHLTFNPTVDLRTSDVLLPTQDGGNSSEEMEHSLETSRITKFLMSKAESMLRTETS